MVAALVLAGLVTYALTGGADFGGGVWDLFATGPTAKAQRRAIATRIGPVWEANHVWLIFVIVLLFSCFPRAYATIGTALHVPLVIMLIGIVLRGSAFVFRAYDSRRDDVQLAWSRVFAIASVVTPFMLGVVLGAASSGTIDPDNLDYWGPWLAPFPMAVGAFSVAVFAFLAAVYLCDDVHDPALQDAFRTRAYAATVAVTVLAWGCFFLAFDGAPHLIDGLWNSTWALPFHGCTVVIGVAVLHALYSRSFGRAKWLAIVQVTALIGGYGAAQYPNIVAPHVTFDNAAAPDSVLTVVLTAVGIGSLFLVPSYVYMIRVFRGGAGVAEQMEDPRP